jgi:hypothetical protein
VAATPNSKTLLGIKEEEEKEHDVASSSIARSCYCSICGKKLKNFNKRRTSQKTHCHAGSA